MSTIRSFKATDLFTFNHVCAPIDAPIFCFLVLTPQKKLRSLDRDSAPYVLAARGITLTYRCAVCDQLLSDVPLALARPVCGAGDPAGPPHGLRCVPLFFYLLLHLLLPPHSHLPSRNVLTCDAAAVIGKAEGTGAERHGHVTALSVAPEYRRLGLSRKFMAFLEHASDEVYRGLFVDLYVRCVNGAAIAMYEDFGYSVYRRVREYYDNLGLGLSPRDEEDGFGGCLFFGWFCVLGREQGGTEFSVLRYRHAKTASKGPYATIRESKRERHRGQRARSVLGDVRSYFLVCSLAHLMLFPPLSSFSLEWDPLDVEL